MTSFATLLLLVKSFLSASSASTLGCWSPKKAIFNVAQKKRPADNTAVLLITNAKGRKISCRRNVFPTRWTLGTRKTAGERERERCDMWEGFSVPPKSGRLKKNRSHCWGLRQSLLRHFRPLFQRQTDCLLHCVSFKKATNIIKALCKIEVHSEIFEKLISQIS